MADLKELVLEFSSEKDRLIPSELGDFIFLFNGIYVLSKQVLQEISIDQLSGNTDKYVLQVKDKLSKATLTEISEILSDNNQSDLQIVGIRKNSPLEIVIAGCAIPLVVSFILTGGKFNLSQSTGIQIETTSLGEGLKSLAEGIQALKEAFQFKTGEKTVYSLKIDSIKLSKDEYSKLMTEVKGQGGFQNLLRELQNRIDKQGRTLELYPSDIDKIKNYGSNSKRHKGGFQGRVNRIFGKHIDLS